MSDESLTFEQIMTELEAANERLSSGELGIEAAVELYERAERLGALARARLEELQARVDRLATKTSAGTSAAGVPRESGQP
jgi:exodeoxyribonuclease VII small subunit